MKQGLGVVLAGSIEPQGSGYGISVKATQAVTGKVIASAEGRASSKDQVLDVATRLVDAGSRRRSATRRRTSAQMFAMASLSATSLEVVRHWVAGREAAVQATTSTRRCEAIPRPWSWIRSSASATQAWPLCRRTWTKQQDAEKYIKEALRYSTA